MKVSTILDQIDVGAMALPQFQRGYVLTREWSESSFIMISQEPRLSYEEEQEGKWISRNKKFLNIY